MITSASRRRQGARQRLPRAARGEPVPHTPVWFMRQAGRSLPEYLALREGIGMLESCMDPDLVVEITLQPVRRYGVDAAIFFSDIVLPLKAVGVDLDIKPGRRPGRGLTRCGRWPTSRRSRTSPPSTSRSSPRRCAGWSASSAARPLIGFAGAPFTVASYLVEGGPSKEHAKTKAMMFGAPDVWDALMRKIAGIAATYLEVQVDAGASAVQLFDSWAGALTPADYRGTSCRTRRAVLERAGALGVPRIHFGVGTTNLLGPDGRGRRRRGRRRLADAPGRRDPAGGRPVGPGQPRPDPGLRAHRRDDRPRRRDHRGRAAPPGATSSTSATASSPPPIPTS